MAIIVLIVSIGAWFRFRMVGIGLPFLYDPDEADFVGLAYRMLAEHDPNPHWFGHPGTVTIYLLSLLYGLYGVIGVIAGWFANLHAVGAEFWSDPSAFYTLGRASIACFGVASLWLLYRVGAEAVSRGVGLLAAALLACSPLHIEYSGLIRTDIQQTFFLLGVGLFSIRIARRGGTRDYVMTGICLGLAIATKYPSIFGSTMIVTAWLGTLKAPGPAWWRRLGGPLLAGGVSVATVFVASPYLFLDFRQVLSDVFREARPTHLSATSHGFSASLWFYIHTSIGESLGWFGQLLALLGTVHLLRHQRAVAAIVLVFALGYLAFIASLHLVWTRWAIPVLPFACLLTAVGVFSIGSWAAARLAAPWHTALVGGLLVAYLGFATGQAWATVARLTAVSPVTAARDWCNSNIPAGARVLVERYTPQFDAGRFEIYEVALNGALAVRDPTASRYHVPQGVIGELADPAEIRRSGIQYVILGNDFDRRLAEPARYESSLKPYQTILAQYQLLYELKVGPATNRASAVRVLRVN